MRGWNAGRLTQAEAARILGVCERSFRRYLGRYEECGLDGLIDRRLEQASNRQAPADEVKALYSDKHSIFRINAKEADPEAETQFSRAARELGIE